MTDKTQGKARKKLACLILKERLVNIIKIANLDMDSEALLLGLCYIDMLSNIFYIEEKSVKKRFIHLLTKHGREKDKWASCYINEEQGFISLSEFKKLNPDEEKPIYNHSLATEIYKFYRNVLVHGKPLITNKKVLLPFRLTSSTLLGISSLAQSTLLCTPSKIETKDILDEIKFLYEKAKNLDTYHFDRIELFV